MRGGALAWSALIVAVLLGTAMAQSPAPNLPWGSDPYLGLADNSGRSDGALVHHALEFGPQAVVDAPISGPQQVGDGCCPWCHCAPCECPQQPAPCQPCPHVSTLLPYWNVNIFGALQGHMLYNTARPVAPGIPFFLAPGSQQPENTLDIFARSSSIGALFTGPEFGGLQAGGLVLFYFYNDALIVDRYGLLPVQAWGDLKNED